MDVLVELCSFLISQCSHFKFVLSHLYTSLRFYKIRQKNVQFHFLNLQFKKLKFPTLKLQIAYSIQQGLGHITVVQLKMQAKWIG